MNLLAVSFALTYLGFTSGSGVPTFSWLQTPKPVLKIGFPNGKSDFAVLSSFNPIPLQADERQEDVDTCIFDGYLNDENDVYVTVTGCAFTDTFNVQFRSQHLDHYMFSVVDGQVKPVESVFRRRDVNFEAVRDEALRFEPATRFNDTMRALNPKGYVATVKVRYDENFKAKHGADAVNVVRRVMAQAQNIWKWPSLTSSLTFQIDPSVDAVAGKFVAANDIDKAGVFSTTAVNVNVMMAFRNNQGGTVGIAYLGSACGQAKNRIALCEYMNNDLKSAEIVAHEIGHNMNMDHDFADDTPGKVRKDSKGKVCSGIGGVMDYYGKVDKWSTCSVEDFTALTNKPNFCLKPN